GSFVVFTKQAFRPHVMDMFEPQDHPNVIAYPGAPPTRPYDNAGWTLALQMGVAFDRILDGFTGPFEKVTDWNVKPAPSTVRNAEDAGAIVLDRRQNDAVIAVNRALAHGAAGVSWHNASFFVTGDARLIDDMKPLGIRIARQEMTGATAITRAPRIALWDQYGG